MDKINIIVFSKDRALQLDLFIRSFNRFVKDADKYMVKILYTASQEKFFDGYWELMGYSTPNMIFIQESVFKKDVIDLIEPHNPYTVFFVDDIVFKEPFDFFDEQMDLFKDNYSIACRSLRLCPGLTYCYALRRSMRQPVFQPHNIFDWTKEEGDYGYPMSQDGHIFRTAEILPFHEELAYSGPNMLEGRLVHKRHLMGKYIICYDKAKIVNNPINRVQEASQNRCGDISAAYLNDMYMDGYMIDLEPFIGFDNVAVHTEIIPTFIKR